MYSRLKSVQNTQTRDEKKKRHQVPTTMFCVLCTSDELINKLNSSLTSYVVQGWRSVGCATVGVHWLAQRQANCSGASFSGMKSVLQTILTLGWASIAISIPCGALSPGILSSCTPYSILCTACHRLASGAEAWLAPSGVCASDIRSAAKRNGGMSLLLSGTESSLPAFRRRPEGFSRVGAKWL